jgi:hypothetical protein
MTLKDNIGFGNIERMDDIERITHAAADGGAAEIGRSSHMAMTPPSGANSWMGASCRVGNGKKSPSSRIYA